MTSVRHGMLGVGQNTGMFLLLFSYLGISQT